MAIEPVAKIDGPSPRSTGPTGSPNQPEAVRPFTEILGQVTARHRVRHGDTLWSICRDRLQAAGQDASPQSIWSATRAVAQSNRLANPDLIHPGQTLDLKVLGGVSGRLAEARPLYALPAPSERLRSAHVFAPVAPTTPLRPSDRRTPPPPPRDHAAAIERLLQTDGLRSAATRPTTPSASPWERLIGEGPRRLTGEFGLRNDPFTGARQHHDGIDIAAPAGSSIYPIKHGRVVFSGWRGAYGRLVIIEHDDGTQSRYAHASQILVRSGQQVAPWMAIAQVGTSGRSTGPHLHFELWEKGRPVDPIPHLTADEPDQRRVRSGRGT